MLFGQAQQRLACLVERAGHGLTTTVVAAHGGQARLRVEFIGDRMRLTDYDWGRWTDEVPALP